VKGLFVLLNKEADRTLVHSSLEAAALVMNYVSMINSYQRNTSYVLE